MDYEQGLEQLRQSLRGTHYEQEFLIYEARLLDNLEHQRRGGNGPQNQVDRAFIIIELNRLAGYTGTTFNDLCRTRRLSQGTGSISPNWLIGGVSVFMVLMLIVGSVFFHLPTRIENWLYPTPTLIPTPRLPDGPGVVQAPNGEYIGVNDGQYQPFDMVPQRVDSNCKQQAAQALQNRNTQGAIPLWNQCLTVDPNDAEPKIYLENQNALRFTHITLLVGLDFPTPSQLSSDQDAIMSTRSALQGAYIAQEDFNKQHTIKLRLLLVNTGNDKSYTSLIAQQIASIVKSDPTVIGILGWQTSANTLNMSSDLYNDGVSIPIISQTASYDNLSEASPHLFQIAPLNQGQADAALRLTKMLGKTHAIVFMDPHNDLASQNLGQDFEQGFIKAFPNSPPPIEEDFTVDHTNTDTFYTDLKDAIKHVQNFDQVFVFFACTTNYDAGQFQNALSKLGNYPLFPIIAGDAGYVAHPASYNRWYVLAYAFHDEYRTLMGDENQFFQKYKNAFNANHRHNGWYGYDIPDAPAIMAYDAASILSHCIDQAHSGNNSQITPQEIEYQLGQTVWAGVSGQINLTPTNTNPDDRALIVLKVVQQVNQHGNKQTGFKMYCIHGTFSKNANNSLPAC